MDKKRQTSTALILVVSVFFIIQGCSQMVITPAVPLPTITRLDLPLTATPRPTTTPTPQPSLTPTATLQPAIEICSPLQGIVLSDLHKITSQGFTPPAPYKDDGHAAVDLAFFTFKEMPSMIGHPVQSILPGTVSLVIDDRFPYGNAILIETPLDLISNELLGSMTLPTPIPQQNLDLVRQCDSDPVYKGLAPLKWDDQFKSIYVLYAHLLEKPEFKPGANVPCGEVIGAVGNTGNSAAEHLHLETRIGPARAEFGTLAMYAPDANTKERYSYCIWTSSGRFQTFNPVMFWEPEP